MSSAHLQSDYLVLSFESSLYILDVSLMSDIWLVDVFYKSLSCLFIPLASSIIEQKLLIMIVYKLLIFPFMDHTYSISSKNCSPNFRPWKFFS